MRVNNQHRLVGNNSHSVSFDATNNMGTTFASGNLRYVIIHYTSGGTASGAISHFKNPQAQASAHIVIDHDGKITQMVPFNRIAWHAGASRWNGLIGLNNYSIGIEITNWGLLQRSATGWRNRVGGLMDDNRVIEARHKNFQPNTINAWEVYDPEQFDAAFTVTAAIISHYNIPAANVIGHDDISPGRKQDPGPAFQLDRFRARLAGRADDGDETYRVRSDSGLHLRLGPGMAHPSKRLLPDGSLVHVVSTDGSWWEVAVLDASGAEAESGWVHSNWLVPA